MARRFSSQRDGRLHPRSRSTPRGAARRELAAASAAVLLTVSLTSPSGARADDEAKLAAAAKTLVRSIDALPLLARSPSGPRRLLRARTRRVGAAATARLRIAGELGPGVPLPEGEGTVEFSIPEPSATRRLHVAVEIDGKAALERDLEVRPLRDWTVFFLPHSHVDIGFTHRPGEVERRQWRNLERAVELADQTRAWPDDARFRWNVEVLWPLDGYLRRAAPERRDRLLAAARRGQIGLDALYGNELTALCRGEELFRLLDTARRLRREHGLPVRSAMISDVPGVTWGLVPALARCGIRYFSSGPNFIPHLPHQGDRIGYTIEAEGDRPFWWESPSGEERVLFWVHGKGYSWFHDWLSGRIAKTGGEPILRYLRELESRRYPWDVVVLRYTVGADNGPPDPDLSRFVRDWNEKYARPRLRIATTSEPFAELERRSGDRLPVRRGDFTPYWEDGAASSARETALARQASERLAQAEILWSLLAPERFPREEFRLAWRGVILFDEHTWGSHDSVSHPESELARGVWAAKRARATGAEEASRSLVRAALAARADRSSPPGGPPRAVEVLSTSSWPRTDLVELEADPRRPDRRVLDEEGREVPAQRLRDGRLAFLARDVPPLGSRVYRIVEGAPAPGGRARAAGRRIETPRLELELDPKTGAIAHWRGRGGEGAGELVERAKSSGLGELLYVAGRDARRGVSERAEEISVLEPGPLVAALRVRSSAPGCRAVTHVVRVVDGLDRIDLSLELDRLDVRQKESIHVAFPFLRADPRVWLDLAWGTMRPQVDQLPGACKNFFTPERWVDVSGKGGGVTWVSLDAPLVEIGAPRGEDWQLEPSRPWVRDIEPSGAIWSWAMNNSWHTNYRASQPGVTKLRYSLRSHGGFDAAAAERFALERCRPLIVASAAPGTRGRPPLLRVEPADAVVTSMVPLSGGPRTPLRLRIFNAAQRPVRAWIRPGEGARGARLWLSDADGNRGEPLAAPLPLSPHALAALRLELPPPERAPKRDKGRGPRSDLGKERAGH